MGALKRPASIAIAIFGLAIACREKDTRRLNVWAEGMRFTVAPAPATPVDCGDLVIAAHGEAVSVLPRCPDQAIAALERLAERDTAALSDLAAAYYVRARSSERPMDYLRAWDAATHAIALPEAQFNRPRIEEALGLPAIARNDGALKEWWHNAALLPDELCAGDRQAVARLIAPFPYAAELHLNGTARTYCTPAQLRLLAEELSRLTGEPVEGAAAAKLVARMLKARENTQRSGLLQSAATELESIEREARARGYQRIALRALAMHAYCRLYGGRFIESLADYDRAIAEYDGLHDRDAATDTRMRRISALHELGQYEIAWNEMFGVLHDFPRLTQLATREALVNQVVTTVLAAGSPGLATRYADAAIDFHRRQLRQTTDPEAIRVTFFALAGALDVRARAEAALDRTAAAKSDVDEARRLSKGESDVARQVLQARNEAVRGELLLRHDPVRAVDALTAAIAQAPELPSLRATLYFERAEARLAIGQNTDAENDFKAGLRVLRGEERRAVENRQTGEEYLSGYFSRFERSSRKFISYLVDQGRARDALQYAEQTRAFEPLSRLMDPAEIDGFSSYSMDRNGPLRRRASRRSCPRTRCSSSTAFLTTGPSSGSSRTTASRRGSSA